MKAEGLDPVYTLTTPGKAIPNSIKNGTCDLAQSAIATGFAALEKENEKTESPAIIHFAQINARDGFFMAGYV